MKKACYSINRKAGYVTIYNNDTEYPLEMWDEYKTANDCTHQEVADQLLAYSEQQEQSV